MKTKFLLVLALLFGLGLSAHAEEGHDHSHEPLMPAPQTALESVQQVDAICAALGAAVREEKLKAVHDLTEALTIALSGLQRLGAEGLPASKATRLEGLAENMRKAGDALHHSADDKDQAASLENLEKLEKLLKLIPTLLPDLAQQATETPLEQDFPGKVKVGEAVKSEK